MAKKIDYSCEVCRGTHFDKAAIVGIWWNGTTLYAKQPIETDNHLCLTCIAAIRAMILP